MKPGNKHLDAACGRASLNTTESRSGEKDAHPKTAKSSAGVTAWNSPNHANRRDGGEGGRADSKPGTQTAGCASEPAPSSPPREIQADIAAAPVPSGATRNCEKFKTLSDALLASGEMTADAPGLAGMGKAQLVRFVKWLFAPAKTKEGK